MNSFRNFDANRVMWRSGRANKLSLWFCALALVCVTTPASAANETTCSYDASSGKPNPLGMRTFIVMQTSAADVHVMYMSLPLPVEGDARVSLMTQRQLVFHGSDIDTARKRLRESPALYEALLGHSDSEGFAVVDAVLKCRASE